MIDAGTTAIAYETVTGARGELPLLTPMSEIAGRLAVLASSFLLQSPMGGKGTLVAGAPGVDGAHAVVVGGGTVGTHAARLAVGMGANVVVLEKSLARIRELEAYFQNTAKVLMSDRHALELELERADIVIGAVLIPGAAAPKLIREANLATMANGTVIADVAIDQGGCAETSRATTHREPTFVVDGVVHYCVANMPGAVPATSTRALTNATLPYVALLAEGNEVAFERDPGLQAGLVVADGDLRSPSVVESN